MTYSNIIFEIARLTGEKRKVRLLHILWQTTKCYMIKGHIIVKVRNGSLSERLQLNQELTLEKAINQSVTVHQ